MITNPPKDAVEVASHALFSDPCRDCRWWVLATPDYRRCERGASPSYASQLGRCAKREPKSNSENAGGMARELAAQKPESTTDLNG